MGTEWLRSSREQDQSELCVGGNICFFLAERVVLRQERPLVPAVAKGASPHWADFPEKAGRPPTGLFSKMQPLKAAGWGESRQQETPGGCSQESPALFQQLNCNAFGNRSVAWRSPLADIYTRCQKAYSVCFPATELLFAKLNI